jgi:succinate dehydrogenase / fumarate reductase flavoprotein subunit
VLANVDDRQLESPSLMMRGGQYVNNWRMVELHAKEAPDRVRELEAGARFLIAPPMGEFYSAIRRHRATRGSPIGDRTGWN